MPLKYLKQSNAETLIKENGLQPGKAGMSWLDAKVGELIQALCDETDRDGDLRTNPFNGRNIKIIREK